MLISYVNGQQYVPSLFFRPVASCGAVAIQAFHGRHRKMILKDRKSESFSLSILCTKPNEVMKFVVTAFIGISFGVFIGITSARYGLTSMFTSNTIQIPASEPYHRCPPPVAVYRNYSHGAELLPSKIVVPETDYYMRRLWGKPEEDLPIKPRYLVTFTVGFNQREIINAAVSKFSNNWTIVLFHYDGRASEWEEYEWAQRVIHISARKQSKWWFAKRFLHPDVVAPYDYVFIWDEDLGLENFDAEAYIEMVRKHGLEISQPALEASKKLTWRMTMRLFNSEVHRETIESSGRCKSPHKPPCRGFVEIMAPVFSKIAWRCVWHLIQNDLIHGWGLDFELGRCVKPAFSKVGVVDAQWVVHKFLPSLGSQGESSKGRAPWEGVRERCGYEWNVFQDRLAAADDAALKEARGQTPV